jgi:hypothetical protein
VLNSPDKDTIADAVIDKELNEIKYEKVADWFAYFEKLARIGYPGSDEIETLGEIKASRDILVHNKGIVNHLYLWRAGKKSRFKEGEYLEIPEYYHRECWQFFKKLISTFASQVLSKIPT